LSAIPRQRARLRQAPIADKVGLCLSEGLGLEVRAECGKPMDGSAASTCGS